MVAGGRGDSFCTESGIGEITVGGCGCGHPGVSRSHDERMPRRISFSEAAGMLRSRADILATGVTERQLADLLRSGTLKRLHRGSYVAAADWDDLWDEGRQLLRVIAVDRASSSAQGHVYVQESAAVLWGLPLYRHTSALVHTLIRGARHTRTVSGVARHDLEVREEDIVVRHGLLCTSLTRTVFDLARAATCELALSAADAALSRVAVHRHQQDADTAASWREELARLERPGLRGIRQARWVADFADGRAQLPGESVSRLQLFRLGYDSPELQVQVIGAEGDRYFLDFGFRRARKFGEFDGEGKYLESALRSSDTPSDEVLREKRREDDVRGVTGWGFARWGSAHIRTPDALGARLQAFGIRPPG